MEVVPLGDSALLVRATGTSSASDVTALDLARRLQAPAIRGVIDVVPAYTSVAIFFDASTSAFENLNEQIALALTGKAPDAARASSQRTIEIPVCYDRELAPDLGEVAEHVGLAPAEVVARHSSADYCVACIGFTPGFPYLSGLPGELAMPRRATPRKEVPAGAVAIGGNQTGIYPQKSPGGWNIIGRTPVRLFAPDRGQPALLRAGDFHSYVVSIRASAAETSA